MGGKALKSTFTRRYNKDEYFELRREILRKLTKINLIGRDIPAYRLKDSFGDMDILILNDGNIKNIKELIQIHFNPSEMHFNGNVWSFDYKELQIDFILTPTRNWETAYNFFSWNDLGNLIGKIAHKFNLKYGFEGLVFKYRLDNDKTLGEIVLSKNTETILEFLGFDYNKWCQGFDTMEEIFDYVINSKYFSIDIFKFENLNHIDKKRNKKRKMYNQFLQYVTKNELNLPNYQFESDKSKYYSKIEATFPGFLSKLEKFQEKEQIRKKIASKFNGNLIMEKYGYTGNELGKIISDFKAIYSSNFSHYILDTPEIQIWEDFDNFLKNKNL